MRRDVADDLSDSAHEFLRVVWPRIKPWFGGGEVQPIEAVSHNGFDKELDTLAGIDAWHLMRGECAIRGIASRVQWGTAWNTFTIRISRPSGVPTEYQKRIHQLDNLHRGILLPYATVQGYVANPKRQGPLLSVAVVTTRDLFDLARGLVDEDRHREVNGKLWGIRTTYSGERLLWISWRMLKEAKVKHRAANDSGEGEMFDGEAA